MRWVFDSSPDERVVDEALSSRPCMREASAATFVVMFIKNALLHRELFFLREIDDRKVVGFEL
jgi:hypothetical protein